MKQTSWRIFHIYFYLCLITAAIIRWGISCTYKYTHPGARACVKWPSIIQYGRKRVQGTILGGIQLGDPGCCRRPRYVDNKSRALQEGFGSRAQQDTRAGSRGAGSSISSLVRGQDLTVHLEMPSDVWRWQRQDVKDGFHPNPVFRRFRCGKVHTFKAVKATHIHMCKLCYDLFNFYIHWVCKDNVTSVTTFRLRWVPFI